MTLKADAVILVSGGLDSAVVLASVHHLKSIALFIHYGQRHKAELDCAIELTRWYRVPLHQVELPISELSTPTFLTDRSVRTVDKVTKEEDIPNTWVPFRNMMFLTTAAMIAHRMGAREIYTGVNAVDYSGYPDCRPGFIKAMQEALNMALPKEMRGLKIQTPLINMSKADIVRWGHSLKVPFEVTNSCYNPMYTYEEGDEFPRLMACGECPSCEIRKKAFKEAGIKDPILYKTK